VSEPASITSGIAARYATAIFDLAKEEKALATLEADVAALDGALGASEALRAMIASPVIDRASQGKAIGALAARMGLSPLMANALALLSSKRRLFVLPQVLADLQGRISAEKGEMTAEVTAATALTDAQAARLSALLKARVGKDVKLKTTVDEGLIGGLVVKLGSTMIDTSVRSKLAALQNAMKEVG
jgi:F-type H+-transporting ATPase subunit delta